MIEWFQILGPEIYVTLVSDTQQNYGFLKTMDSLTNRNRHKEYEITKSG